MFERTALLINLNIKIMKRVLFFFPLFLLILLVVSCNDYKKEIKAETSVNTVWPKEKAAAWMAEQPWLVGCDYIPANAINQLEMWQAETFDTITISKEMALAKSIGFNTLRVYLHSLGWEADSAGFKSRINTFLDITSRNGIRPLFVIFDDCWNPYPKIGAQPQGIPYTHNSGWVQDPGMDAHKNWDVAFPKLERYVKDVLTSFADDKRILMWDLYNEPGNGGPISKDVPRPAAYGNESLPLLKKVVEWARSVNPSQPLTMGVWNLDLKELNQFQVENSDILTYHNYSDRADHEREIKFLQMHGRPMICTEYMSRGSKSTFADILPMLKAYHIGAINWGFVSGKTQTIYPWDSWDKEYKSTPKLWFHDIFHPDYSPYDASEVELIKSLTGAK